jgi:steroid delta-isomerase-like uncharacterized protein
MSEQEHNKALVRSLFEDCVNQGFDRVVARQLCAVDYVHHDPNLPQPEIHGLETYLDITSAFPAAFPNLSVVVEDLVAEDDRVAARVTVRGTHEQELMGIPASGNQVEFAMHSINRVVSGKIVEGWVMFDALKMLQQIGAMPGA